jgi:hypothetical protein
MALEVYTSVSMTYMSNPGLFNQLDRRSVNQKKRLFNNWRYIPMYETEQISRTGYNKLMAELNRLEKEELPEVRKTVAEARE